MKKLIVLLTAAVLTFPTFAQARYVSAPVRVSPPPVRVATAPRVVTPKPAPRTQAPSVAPRTTASSSTTDTATSSFMGSFMGTMGGLLFFNWLTNSDTEEEK